MKSKFQFRTGLIGVAMIVALGGCLGGGSDSGVAPAPNPNPGPTNRAPTITGNPATAVTVGDLYSFTPVASDPDGDALTFTIENNPVWADFDESTGQVSGTPTLGNVGTYSNIRVSVSDGQLTTAMAGFTVDVTQVGTVSATLNWTAPEFNEDGTPLTDLAGYTIFYGTSSGNYTNEIPINNPSVTTYIVENLSPNTYYFAAKAFNSTGVQSRFSGEAVTTLN